MSMVRMGLHAAQLHRSTCSSLPLFLRRFTLHFPRSACFSRNINQGGSYYPLYHSPASQFTFLAVPRAVQCRTMAQNSVEAGASGTNGTGIENRQLGWKIKMLYDGDCPLCMREVNMLRERNKKYGEAIKFVDICAEDYAAEENNDIDFETAMGRIHAIRQDGEVLTNIAAFRALYEEVGLGWVYAITKNEPWGSLLDKVYEFWAKYRLPITGRPSLVEVLEKRRQRKVRGGYSITEETRCRMD